MRNSVNISVVMFLLYGLSCGAELPCEARAGDPGQGQVCVCNATYCDTVDPPATLASGLYHRYSTSDATPGFTHTTGSFITDYTAVSDNVTVFTINTSIRYQEIVGFGGSFSVAAGYNLLSLPEGAQENLIQSYFGPSGIEYTFNRVPIGSSDFTTRPFTYDDVSGDVDLQHFNLTDEEYKYKIPFMKRAMAASRRNVSVYGCSWNAPTWMKTKSLKPYNLQGFVQRQYSRTWAAYHVKFLEAYRDNGIKLWAVSGGNEVFFPLMGFSLNNTVWWATGQKAWLKYDLMPLLRAAGLEEVKFLGLDDMRLFAVYWMKRFADDPEAYAMVDGIALHWYMDFFAPELTVYILDIFHSMYPDKRILYTESSINILFGCDKPLLGSWFRGSAYIYNIIQNINHWTSGYIDWNLALDTEGGPNIAMNIDAAVIVNSTSGEFYKQPIFYAMGHFSKFIPPGATRVDMVKTGNGTTDGSTNDFEEDFDDMSKEDIIRMYIEQQSQFDSIPAREPRPTRGPRPKPPVPYLKIPAIVTGLATANPDGSFTVVVANLQNVTAQVRIEDPAVGSIILELEENSINTFVYWH